MARFGNKLNRGAWGPCLARQIVSDTLFSRSNSRGANGSFALFFGRPHRFFERHRFPNRDRCSDSCSGTWVHEPAMIEALRKERPTRADGGAGRLSVAASFVKRCASSFARTQ